jgi:hypothetical protein
MLAIASTLPAMSVRIIWLFWKPPENYDPNLCSARPAIIGFVRKVAGITKKGLFKDCAPDLGVEMSVAQSPHSVEEVWARAAMAEEDKKLGKGYWCETIRASCPQYNAPLATNAKFCPECGAKLKGTTHCAECGAIQTGREILRGMRHKSSVTRS